MRIADVHLVHAGDAVDGPEVLDGGAAVHHDDEGALAAEEVDEQLEEGVEGEGLVDVAEGVHPEGHAEGGEGGEAGGGEDGDEHEDADDVALEEGLAVVFGLEEGRSVMSLLAGEAIGGGGGDGRTGW